MTFWTTSRCTGSRTPRSLRHACIEENKLNFFAPKHVAIPVAVSVFPDEIYAAPQSWAEKAYPKLIHFNRLPKGGHFAAWEQPQAFTEEVRKSFASLR